MRTRVVNEADSRCIFSHRVKVNGLTVAASAVVRLRTGNTVRLIVILEVGIAAACLLAVIIVHATNTGVAAKLLTVTCFLTFPLLMILVPPVLLVGSSRGSRTQHPETPPRLAVHTVDPLQRPMFKQEAQLPEPRVLAEQLCGIDWFQFEKLVELTIKKRGHSVTRSGGANPDGGIDLVMGAGDQVKAVQCKHWKRWKIAEKHIREFVGALKVAGYKKGVFVTLSEFTGPARRLAEEQGIQTVDGHAFLSILTELDADTDTEFQAILSSNSKSCPKCNSPMVYRTKSRTGEPLAQRFWGCSRFPKCRGRLHV